MTSAGRAPTLTFLGATGTVTGSRFLIETDRARVLLDCGLFQGPKALRLRNWESLAVDGIALDPAALDAVVVSHAHVDHVGYLPRLVTGGYAGPVYATQGTVALAGIILPDAGHLQEEEAAYANAKGFSKHRPALPLFTEAEARRSLDRFCVTPFGEEREIAPGVRLVLRHAGHILGAASVELDVEGRRVVWSGDLGRASHPYLRPPQPLVDAADVLLVESTYGDRDVGDGEVGRDVLAQTIRRTVGRGGSLIIPSFAVDRTEVLLYHLHHLLDRGDIPAVPIYVDSPMACAALGVYRSAVEERWPEIRPEAAVPDLFDPDGLVEVRDVEASKRLHSQRFPSIVISASGMATGGRVLHHLRHRLPDPRNTVLLPGYQAEGTRGRLLADGARQLKMLGRYIPVRAEIVNLPVFSAHASRAELLAWSLAPERDPEAIYLVHGEPQASASLAAALGARTGGAVVVPRHGERVRLDEP
jgi:metallo-beta-lactamase family protein